MKKSIIQDIIILSLSVLIIFCYFHITLNYSDNDRAIKVLTAHNYTNIKNLELGQRSKCTFTWFNKHVVGQTQFTATKDGKQHTGTVCLNAFIEDKIVLDN